MRQVPGYPEYSVTEDGRIWSIRRRRWLKVDTSNGYSRVTLAHNGRSYRCFVHRLVLETFVGPCPLGMEACHFPDRSTANNRLENLRWDTRSANSTDAIKHGTHTRQGPHLQGERNPSAKLSEAQVREVDALYRVGHTTQAQLADRFGVHQGTISDIVTHHIWRHLWRNTDGTRSSTDA